MAEPKQLKLEENPETSTINEDRISSLPDSLLCHILEFLPTVTSVRTGILSRRWRGLWKDLLVLDVEEYPWHFLLREHIVPFVDAVLDQRRVPHIRKFKLSWDLEKGEHDVRDAPTRWIAMAIGRHLQELHLGLELSHGSFDLPHGVFTCTSLVSLTLEGQINLCDLSSVYLPSLRNLELHIDSLNYIDELLSGCPVLETLKLFLYEIDSPTIHMPRSLKSLTIEDESFWYYENVIEHLEISTPYLEYLSIKMLLCLRNLVLVGNFSNMVEARLNIFPPEDNVGMDGVVGWVPELLKAICKTKLLVLKYSTIECLLRAPSLDFPEFCYLVHLELELHCFDSKFVIDLLHNCHMLQKLRIQTGKRTISDDWTQQPSEPWTHPASIPNCVMLHLQFFEFGRYQGSTDELAFIAYVLQRGLVLREMKVYTCISLDQKEKDAMLKKLSILPRGSNICQLKFYGHLKAAPKDFLLY